MQTRKHESIEKAARDGQAIDAAMRRAVAKALDERRKLGLPIVSDESRDATPRGGDGQASRRGAA